MGTPFAHLKPNLITSRERIHELDTQTESTVHLVWRTTMPLVLTQVSQGDTTLLSGRQHLQLSRAALDTVGMLDPGLRYCMDYDLWIRLVDLSWRLARLVVWPARQIVPEAVHHWLRKKKPPSSAVIRIAG